MRYPIELKADGRFFLVTFPDIPEALTQGESKEEAMEAAKHALETALDFYFEESRVAPEPSRVKRGGEFVELSASLSAKVLLLNEMIRQEVRPAELADDAAGGESADEPASHVEDRWDCGCDEGAGEDAGDSGGLGLGARDDASAVAVAAKKLTLSH